MWLDLRLILIADAFSLRNRVERRGSGSGKPLRPRPIPRRLFPPEHAVHRQPGIVHRASSRHWRIDESPQIEGYYPWKGRGPRERSPHAGRRALEQPTTNNHCNLPDGQCEPSESKEVRTHQPNAEVTWQQFAGTVPSPTSCRTPKNGRGGRSSTPLCGITDLIGDSAKLLVINVTVSR